jgi:putative phosphoribosyl transferase
MGGDLESAFRIPAAGVILDGDLVVPAGAAGVVVFAHGSGSSRHSPRNRMVATRLQAAGYATLLMDLLTPEEDEVDSRTRKFRFDILNRKLGAYRSPDLKPGESVRRS